MDEYRIAIRVSMAEVNRVRVQRIPRLRLMDGLKVSMGSRVMN